MRILSWIVLATIYAAVIWFIWPRFREVVPPTLKPWAIVGIVFLCSLPQFLFEIVYARPFDVTALKESVNYEFTSGSYAIEFAVLNRDAEWVTIDGEKLPTLSQVFPEEE